MQLTWMMLINSNEHLSAQIVEMYNRGCWDCVRRNAYLGKPILPVKKMQDQLNIQNGWDQLVLCDGIALEDFQCESPIDY